MITETVYATGSRAERFHKTRDCSNFLNAQLLADADCGCDTYCTHRMPRAWKLQEMTISDALGAGKWPCTFCWPGSAAELAIAPCEEDFGHVPVDTYPGTVMKRTHPVCARCFRVKWLRAPGTRLRAEIEIDWPCTSAIILGLAPRTPQGES